MKKPQSFAGTRHAVKHGRRKFITHSVAFAAVLGLKPAFAPAALADGEMNREMFQESVRKRFYFSGVESLDQGTVKLVSVEVLSSTSNLDQYVLSFRGLRGVRLRSGRYDVSNWSGLPYFQVYVDPVKVDKKNREFYAAYFAQIL